MPGAAEGAPGWLLGPYSGGLGLGDGAYLALLAAAFAAYLVVAATAAGLDRRLVWGAIVALVVGFALAPPLLSLDVFSYISYARLGAGEGLNPYDAVPADLVGDPAGSRVEDFRFAVSVYGPLFTLATYPLGLVSVPVAMWALKIAAGASVLAVAALTARLAAVRGISPRGAAAFVALNPLVLVHVVGGAHNDGLMVLALTAAAVGVVAGLAAGPGSALVAGAAIKVSGAFAAPFAVLGADRPASLVAGAAVAAAAVVAVSLAVFGVDVVDALGIVGGNQNESSHYSVPSTVARIAGVDDEPVRYAFLGAYAVLVAWLLWWTWRGGDWLRATAWAAAGLLVASAWLVPWYVIWALPFAAVARDRAVVAVVLAVCALQLPTAL
ncbi:MAG TPA: glycosyltransferase family 87 protein [Solirubrobacterales bacterium]|nr:glycosyltransferase family 87 protein [Solirubrobacterales bacterium]